MRRQPVLLASLAFSLLAAPAMAPGPLVAATGLAYADNGAGCSEGNTAAAVLVNTLDLSGTLNLAGSACGASGASWAAGECGGSETSDVFCYHFEDCGDGRYQDRYLALGLDGSLFAYTYSCAGQFGFASGSLVRA